VSSGEGDSPGEEGRTPAGEARTPVGEGRTSRSGGRTPAGPSSGKPTRKQKMSGKKRERDPGARKTRAALKEEEEANESLEALNVLASECLVCVAVCVCVCVCVCERERERESLCLVRGGLRLELVRFFYDHPVLPMVGFLCGGGER
jgi:hypothetical protein